MRFEDTQNNQHNDFVIKSEPLLKEVNSLKMKYFSEASPYEITNNNNFKAAGTSGKFGNNFNKQYPENAFYAQEYKINNNNNNNINMNNMNIDTMNNYVPGNNHYNNNMNFNNFNPYGNNNNNNNNNNFINTNNFNNNNNNLHNFPGNNMNMNMGNFNNYNHNSQMNLAGFIKPMGVNPFNPPNNSNNQNQNQNNQNN